MTPAPMYSARVLTLNRSEGVAGVRERDESVVIALFPEVHRYVVYRPEAVKLPPQVFTGVILGDAAHVHDAPFLLQI